MQAKAKSYNGDVDFRRVRNLIVETYPATPVGFNWEVRRWDGWRYYDKNRKWDTRRNKSARLWENNRGRLVGAVHQEGSGYSHIQIHPEYRHIEEAMIAWAEKNLAVASENNRRRLSFFIHENDRFREELLIKVGYTNTGNNDITRRLRFKNITLDLPDLAEGYTIRTIHPNDIKDGGRIAELLNAAFNRNFHTPEEYFDFAGQAPCHREGLDQAAVAPDGTFAAYVGAAFENNNKYGVIEPVCTHPAHQRKGLARSLILAALRRLKNTGAVEVLIGTGEGMAANRLYESIGFDEVYKSARWCKEF
jgi:mycothiol synthase